MLKVEHLYKSFNALPVLTDVSFAMKRGETLVVIGPSGTGKSTLLRSINFLERPDRGVVEIDGFRVDSAAAGKKEIYALRRKTSMVFQSYNLIQHRTAAQNIADPLEIVQRMKPAEAIEAAEEALRSVGLSDKSGAYPYQLSGGQQQRVGIARALVLKPSVMLLDEPTSALDPELVGGVLEVIRGLVKQHVTMIIVTHEMRFARNAADRVLFMDQGRIAEDGTPAYIFEECPNPRVYQFLDQVGAH